MKKLKQFRFRTNESDNGRRTVTVRWDSGGMNTLTSEAVDELNILIAELKRMHAQYRIDVVYLTGNAFGLGAGADIDELFKASRKELKLYIKKTLRMLRSIEDTPFRWVARVDSNVYELARRRTPVCLGGVYELALACNGIVAASNAKIGFPEMNLGIFPGAGGTQRLSRRAGMISTLEAVLSGKRYTAEEALVMGLIDRVVDSKLSAAHVASHYAWHVLSKRKRRDYPSVRNAENCRFDAEKLVKKHAGFSEPSMAAMAAVEVIIEGAKLSRHDGIKLETREFLKVAMSHEGKNGLGFFLDSQAMKRRPKWIMPEPLPIKKVGVAGIDGMMGNALAFLLAKADYEVVGWVPQEHLGEKAQLLLEEKCAVLAKKGLMSKLDANALFRRVTSTANLSDLADCDVMVECIEEKLEIKKAFWHKAGAVMEDKAIVGSISSSMGPALLAPFFVAGGGNVRNFGNLHGFSPWHLPQLAFAEVVYGPETSHQAIATMHALAVAIGKTPCVIKDGVAGFLVNALLIPLFDWAWELYMAGTSIEAIDEAMRKFFPQGIFFLGDNTGVRPILGSCQTIEAERGNGQAMQVRLMVEAMIAENRISLRDTGGAFYQYDTTGRRPKPDGAWNGLNALAVETCGPREHAVLGAESIQRMLMRKMFLRACEIAKLLGITPEYLDTCMILGLNMNPLEGGPMNYGHRQGWAADKSHVEAAAGVTPSP